MMRPFLVISSAVLLLVSASGWSRAQSQTEAQSQGPIVLTLRAKATASGPQVKVGDIADLQGGDKSERMRLASLDLAELPLSSQPILVTQQQVGFRLQLAGLSAGSFRLEGENCVHVSRPAGQGLDDKIAAVARQALEQKLSGQGDDYHVELAQPVILPPLSADGRDIHLEGEVRSQIVPPCRVAVEVGVYVRGARRNGILVYLDVKRFQSLPVAIRRIDSGEPLSADNVKLERVPVANATPVPYASKEAVAGLIGRRARRPISAGHPIEPADVAEDTPDAFVIRANDFVHLIANVGSLQVKTRGEALQNGRVGQAIQVRNLDSKSIVTGRVVDRSTVEVEY